MESAQFTLVLKILGVAGVFMSLIIAAVFLVFALVGAIGGEEPANVWVITWNSFFIGLPLYGALYVGVTIREELRGILDELKKNDS
jgi:hypothetical protein